MTAILTPQHSDDRPPSPGWNVNGRMYVHTAARFWAGLLAEIRSAYPGAHRIELRGMSSHLLDPDWLAPEKALERVFEQWISGEIDATLQETIDELTLLGPPTGVRISIGDDERVLYDGALPIEVVDEEVFLYLLAWLLEWSEVPPLIWNNERVSGEVIATEPGSEVEYRLSILVVTKPVEEGLMDRTVTIIIYTGSATTR